MMQKILISLPDDLAARLRTALPPRQRSKIIAQLIAAEVTRREKMLYQAAMDAEQDETLNKDMEDWDNTLQDGLDDESW
jgi:metal-responsive CopG/Arc/MetJ family transcriptional regulator